MAARKLYLGSVGCIVKDQKRSKDFYTKKLGLKVRDSQPKMGYLALGTTMGGEDAELNPWQPTPEVWQEDYEPAMKALGTVTGIGFRTGNLDRTLENLKKAKVKTSRPFEEGDEMRMASFEDPDGNTFFVYEPSKPKVRRAGLLALDFVTVVTRDTKKSQGFFSPALGMKARRLGGDMSEYRFTPKGTAISPFTPKRENYRDPKDYDDDMGHIGEATQIMFVSNDLRALQEKLLLKGVRFKRKAEAAPWGGLEARIYDPDDNEYALIQMKA